MVEYVEFPSCCGADVMFNISRVTASELRRIIRIDKRDNKKTFAITASYQTATISKLKATGWKKVGRAWKNGHNSNANTLQMWSSR